MNCKEFWDKWSQGIDHKEEPDMEEHLSSCRDCKEEMMLLTAGIDILKNDIFQEEPARIWHDMRAEIEKKVQPGKKKVRLQWLQKAIWGLVPASALALLLISLIVKQPSLIREDIYLLAGGMPASSVNVIVNMDQDGENLTDLEEMETETFTGISDPMAALLIETS